MRGRGIMDAQARKLLEAAGLPWRALDYAAIMGVQTPPSTAEVVPGRVYNLLHPLALGSAAADAFFGKTAQNEEGQAGAALRYDLHRSLVHVMAGEAVLANAKEGGGTVVFMDKHNLAMRPGDTAVNLTLVSGEGALPILGSAAVDIANLHSYGVRLERMPAPVV